MGKVPSQLSTKIPDRDDKTGRSSKLRLHLRRRGRELEKAIYNAVLAELAEHGFAELSLEEVAVRARTGKSAIYRRWTTKLDLVVDTIAHSLPDPATLSSSGNLRSDLLSVLRQMADSLAGPVGIALRANIGEVHQHPDLAKALRERAINPRLRTMYELLAAGVKRGEVRQGALTPECVEAGPALIRQRFLEQGPRIPDETIIMLVDNVLIPMLRPQAHLDKKKLSSYAGKRKL